MKNIVLISLLLLACWSCSNEEGRIHVELPGNAFSSYPIAGGAVMHYILPDDPDIVGIYVRYTDARGKEMLRVGSAASDSLLLVGFDEAVENVPAEVTFYYADDRESQPFDMTFSTGDSGPVAFLKNLEVLPYWGGFALRYCNAPATTGMVHVCYWGIDPITQQEDTIRIESFALQESDSVEYHTYTLDMDNIIDPMVIIRAEDFRGYMVGEKIWTDVKFLEMKKLDPKNFTFLCDRSIEDDEVDMLGAKYLFDGDTKGVIQWEHPGKYYSFLAGPDAAGKNAAPMYIDMKEEQMLGEFRIYAMIDHDRRPDFGELWGEDSNTPAGQILSGSNQCNAPCELTIYGLADDGKAPIAKYDDVHALEGWEEIGHFEQGRNIGYEKRWCNKGYNMERGNEPLKSLAQLEAEAPTYMSILFPVSEKKYRYLKIVINEVFTYIRPESAWEWWLNPKKYVQFHELEIYTEN